MFNAILLNKNDDGSTAATLGQIDDAQLPADGDVTVAIDYSTINYKDGLAITGRAPVVRKWPMVPGIDGPGRCWRSSHPDWKAGDAFILNGWGVGETHMGLPGAARAPERRLADTPARRHVGAHRDGDRHRGLYRDAVGAGIAGTGRAEGQRRDPGHRRIGRRRQRRHRHPVRLGLHGGGLHRQAR